MCHSYHHLFDPSIVALRFFTVFGPRQRPDLAIHKFAALMRDGRPIPVFGDGSSARDYTFIDDIIAGVRGAIDLVTRDAGCFEIVNLGGSDPISLSDMIRVLSEELGIEPEIDRLPMQPGDVVRTWARVDKARELLGYEPGTSFRAGVQRFVEWL